MLHDRARIGAKGLAHRGVAPAEVALHQLAAAEERIALPIAVPLLVAEGIDLLEIRAVARLHRLADFAEIELIAIPRKEPEAEKAGQDRRHEHCRESTPAARLRPL